MKNKILLITLMSIGISFSVNAQDVSIIRNAVDVYGNNPINGTPRYVSMGGAMGSLGGDVSAITENPAGLGVFITSDFQSTFSNRNSSNLSSLNGIAFDKSIKKGTSISQIGTVLNLNLDPTSNWKSVNFGFNYSSQSIENYIESPGNRNITMVNNPEIYLSRHAYDRLGDTSLSNIAIGGNYNDKIYTGLSFNFKSADIEQNDFFELLNSTNNASAIYYKQYLPYKEKSNGFSISAGVISRFDNGLRMGLSVETPTWWNIDRIYTEYWQDNNRNWGSSTYQENRSLTSPGKVSASLGFVPNKHFAFDVDYALHFSKPKMSNTGTAFQTQFNDFMQSQYKTVSDLRIGGEYRIKSLRLRAGYAYRSSPFKTSSLLVYDKMGKPSEQSYSDLYLSKQNTYSVGMGYEFKPFYINVAYQYLTSKYDNPYFAGNYISVEGNHGLEDRQISVVSKVDNKQSNVFVSIGLKF